MSAKSSTGSTEKSRSSAGDTRRNSVDAAAGVISESLKALSMEDDEEEAGE